MGVGVSFSQNKGNLSHNERKFYTNNIDIDRSKDNSTILFFECGRGIQRVFWKCY